MRHKCAYFIVNIFPIIKGKNLEHHQHRDRKVIKTCKPIIRIWISVLIAYIIRWTIPTIFYEINSFNITYSILFLTECMTSSYILQDLRTSEQIIKTPGQLKNKSRPFLYDLRLNWYGRLLTFMYQLRSIFSNTSSMEISLIVVA